MDDQYDFIKLIGKGATGGVYEARCKTSGKHFTIRRFFSDDGVLHEGWELEFLKIVQQLSKVKHPNVSPILNASLDADGAYVVTEFQPSGALSELCKSGIAFEDFKLFVRNGLSALIALHDQEIAHGRLGLDSYLVCYNADDSIDKFVLKDYGLRRIAPLIQGKDPASQLPTDPVFLSPEHFESGLLDDITDLYMFGQLCYVMIAGFHPIAGKSVDESAILHFEHSYKLLSDYLPDLPKDICDWVDQMTQPNPENRPKSAAHALSLFEKSTNRLICETAL